MVGDIKNYIKLDRRFVNVGELTDSEELDELLVEDYEGLFGQRVSLNWDDVIESPRAIVTASGGSGKSEELRHLVDSLRKQGKSAFYLPLEDLHDRALTDALDLRGDLVNFEDWQESSDKPAWFLLDARDELTLTQKTLERCLQQFSRSVYGDLNRIRVVLTSRPVPQLANVDRQLLAQTVPVVSWQPASPLSDGSRPGMGAMRLEDNTPSSVALFAMQPLTRKQMLILADRWLDGSTGELEDKFDRDNAWKLYNRPYALLAAIKHLNQHSQLGTAAEQRESLARTILEDTNKEIQVQVASDKLMAGAARIALAGFLCKNRIFNIGDSIQPVDWISPINIQLILPDWTIDEQRTFLGRGIFDPRGHGTVSFHDRSLQEYLAARALRNLSTNTHIDDIKALLFSSQYGQPVMYPSMRPVAVWLAIEDFEIEQEILLRDPIALMKNGDPGSLSLKTRRQLLTDYASQYRHSEHPMHGIEHYHVHRLAHPDLSETIERLWIDSPDSYRVRRLLLECIEHGQIVNCSGLVRACIDADVNHRLLIPAVMAYSRCVDSATMKLCAQTLVKRSDGWSPELLEPLITHLYPDFISVDELIKLIRNAGPDKSTQYLSQLGKNLSYLFRQTHLSLHDLQLLRIGLTDLMVSSFDDTHGRYSMTSDYSRLGYGLSEVCLQLLEHSVDAESLRASAVVLEYGKVSNSLRDKENPLKLFFGNADEVHRSYAFCTAIDLAFELSAGESDIEYVRKGCQNSILDIDLTKDTDWLTKLLNPKIDMRHRQGSLITLLSYRKEDPHTLLLDGSDLRSAVDDSTSLIKSIDDYEQASKSNRSWKHESVERAQKEAEETAQHELARVERISAIVSNPINAFSCSQRESTLINIYSICFADQNRELPRPFNLARVAETFSPDIELRTHEAFVSCWRNHKIDPTGDVVTWSDVLARTGVLLEAQLDGWAESLSDDEVKLAFGLSVLWPHSISEHLDVLAQYHSSTISRLMKPLLDEELRRSKGKEGRILLIHLRDLNLQSVFDCLSQLFLDAMTSLAETPEYATKEGYILGRLDSLLDVLSRCSCSSTRQQLVGYSTERYREDPTGPAMEIWLKAIGKVDPLALMELIKNSESEFDSQIENTDWAERVFGTVFRRDCNVVFGDIEHGVRAGMATALYEMACRHIKPSEDQERTSGSISRREDAEGGRSQLFSVLVECPGAKAHTMLHHLLTVDGLSADRETLINLATTRAEEDSDTIVRSPEEIGDAIGNLTFPPVNDATLETSMLRALQSVSDFYHTDDTSTIGHVRTIDEETVVQNEIASRLKVACVGKFIIDPEGHVKDRRRIDIRLINTENKRRAAIELKLYDHFNPSELLKAIEGQLINGYLKHEDCRIGCLLVVRTVKRYKFRIHPETKKRAEFNDIITWLQSEVDGLQQEHTHSIRLSVVGIDLSE